MKLYVDTHKIKLNKSVSFFYIANHTNYIGVMVVKTKINLVFDFVNKLSDNSHSGIEKYEQHQSSCRCFCIKYWNT